MKIPLFLCLNMILAVVSPGAMAAKKACTLDEVYGSCEPLRASGPILKIRKDGVVIPNIYKLFGATEQDRQNPEFGVALKKLNAAPSDPVANQARLATMETFVRDAYIEIALDGRKADDPNLDETTKNILSRLRGMSVSLAEESDLGCSMFGLAAEYQDKSNQVKICQAFLNISEPMLVFVIAHEFAHAVDSCMLHKSVGSIPAAPVSGTNTITKTVACVGAQRGDAEENQSRQDYLEKRLTEARTALKNSDPGLIDARIEQILQTQRASIEEQSNRMYTAREKFRQTSPSCSNDDLKIANQASERSADTLAVTLVKKYLRGKTLTDEQKKDVIELQAQLACGAKLSGGASFDFPEYPQAEGRLDIFMQEPEMQALFGCQFQKTSQCSEADVKAGAGTGTKLPKSQGGFR